MASLDDFDEIVKPYYDQLYSFAYYLSGDETEAKDVFQETIVKLINNFDRYEKGTNFKAWAFRVMKNLFIDRRRKKKPDTTDFEEFEPEGRAEVEPWSDIETMDYDTLMNRFFSDRVKDAMLELKEHYRITLLLNSVHDLAYKDIAEIMDCPIGTVMSRLYRARKQLKEKLHDYASEQGFTKQET